MKKKSFVFCIAFVLLIGGFSVYKMSDVHKKYNIILIVSDALRSDMLGCYGGDVDTPNIDWLAEKGTVFEHSYSAAPWTTPSSVAMFSGVSPDIYRDGFYDDDLRIAKFKKYTVPDSDFLLAEYLKKQNYGVKKDVENNLARLNNAMQGFEDVKSYSMLTIAERNNIEHITGINNECVDYEKMYGFLNYILAVNPSHPFFLHKWFKDPHKPYSPPEKFKKKINIDYSRLPKEKEYYCEVTSTFFWAGIVREMTNYEQKYIRSLYKKEIEFVDERVGFILKALKYKNTLENTFIIFTSDHGELLGEKQDWGHSQNYSEELVHVPLIIAGPGIPEGKRIKNFVSTIGLMPTLADLLKISFSNNNQEKSFASLMSKNPFISFTYSFMHDHPIYLSEANSVMLDAAIVENKHKLISSKKPLKLTGNKCILYDIENDPFELEDLLTKRLDLVNNMLNTLKSLKDENLKKRKKYLSEKEEMEKNDNKIDLKVIEQMKALGYIQ
jgi:arylsulfatase A-like enzyme